MKKLVIFLLLLTASVFADDEIEDLMGLSIEELLNIEISTVSKSSVRLAEVPASITVITKGDIRNHNWKNLSELIAAQYGFQVFTDRIYNFIAPRGNYQSNDPNSRILLLIDGHSVVEFFGYFNGHLPSVDLEFVERVEIVRGPQSATYGTNAMFAVINVITKKDDEGVHLGLGGGEAGGQKFTASIGHKFTDKIKGTIRFSFDENDRESLFFDEYAETPSGGHSKASANTETRQTVSFNLTMGHFSLHGMMHQREKHVPTGVYGGLFNDDRTVFEDTNSFVELVYDRSIGEKTSIKARLYSDDYSFEGRYVYQVDPTWTLGPPYESERNLIDNNSIGGEILATMEWNDRQTTTAGIEWKRYRSVDFEYFSENDPEGYLNEQLHMDPNENVLSIFALHRLKAGEKTTFELGLHHDDYESVGGHLSLRGSMVRSFGQTVWKVLYGEAFRAPNFWELNGGFFLVGNDALEPETVKTLENLIERPIGSKSLIQSSVFFYELDNNIRADNGINFENIKGVEAYGADLEYRYKGTQFKGYVNGSYSQVEHAETGERIEFTAEWTLKSGLIYTPKDKGYNFVLETRSTGPRIRGAREQGKLPSYHVADFSFNCTELLPGLDFSISVKNLFDDDYQHPSFIGDLASWNLNSIYPVYDIPGDGRRIMAKLSYRF